MVVVNEEVYSDYTELSSGYLTFTSLSVQLFVQCGDRLIGLVNFWNPKINSRSLVRGNVQKALVG